MLLDILAWGIVAGLTALLLWMMALNIRDSLRKARLPRYEREANQIVEERFRDGDMDDIQSRAW